MVTTAVYLKKVRRPRPGEPNRRVWALRWKDSRGKDRFETIGVCGTLTKRQAQAIRRKKQSDLDGGRVQRDRPRSMTLQQFRPYVKESLEGVVKPATMEVYLTAIDHAKKALGELTKLDKIDHVAAGRIRRHLEDRGLAAATRRKTISTLRTLFNRALRWRLVTQNPFVGEPLPRVQSKQKRIYSTEEIEAMVKAARTPWWKAFITLAATSGLRLQELLHLQWTDIDFDAGFVTVSAKRAGTFKTKGGEECPIVEWSAKTHQERSVPVPNDTLKLLRQLKQQSEGIPYIFLSLDRLARIAGFSSSNGNTTPTKVLNNLLRDFKVIQSRAALNAGLKSWRVGTLHDLRKSYGTHTAEIVPMHVLQKWMGHKDSSTTVRYYLGVPDRYAEIVRQAS